MFCSRSLRYITVVMAVDAGEPSAWVSAPSPLFFFFFFLSSCPPWHPPCPAYVPAGLAPGTVNQSIYRIVYRGSLKFFMP
jgi:hypothetical protein